MQEEDHLLGMAGFGYGLHDVLDVVDRIRDASILRHGFVTEVDLTGSIHGHV